MHYRVLQRQGSKKNGELLGILVQESKAGVVLS